MLRACVRELGNEQLKTRPKLGPLFGKNTRDGPTLTPAPPELPSAIIGAGPSGACREEGGRVTGHRDNGNSRTVPNFVKMKVSGGLGPHDFEGPLK